MWRMNSLVRMHSTPLLKQYTRNKSDAYRGNSHAICLFPVPQSINFLSFVCTTLDNWAMLYAQRLALKFQVPLHVCFCLVPSYQADTLRHLSFMLGGLMEVEQVRFRSCSVMIQNHNFTQTSVYVTGRCSTDIL